MPEAPPYQRGLAALASPHWGRWAAALRQSYANDRFSVIEKTMKVFKSHRDAGDFDGRFIRDAVDGQ